MKRTRLSSRGVCGGMLLLAAVGVLTGCGRTLTIRQGPHINTASQAGRPADKRTGEPLELTIVCVYPQDVQKPANDLLRPGSRITARDWYERRPTGAGEDAGKFVLPADQVLVLTNDSGVYGKKIGQALRGGALDGEAPVKKSINFRWGDLHDDRAIIYVFPKFIGRDGGVLPAAPATFHPPGAYTSDLQIEVGVEENQPPETGQYVRVLSPRKMHGKG